MDDFDKRATFYSLLIACISFFMFFYFLGIGHWNEIYEEAQESIWESKSTIIPIDYCVWLEIDTRGCDIPDFLNPESKVKCKFKDIIVIKIDSVSLQWFDTIKIIKNNDTIKIALEDL